MGHRKNVGLHNLQLTCFSGDPDSTSPRVCLSWHYIHNSNTTRVMQNLLTVEMRPTGFSFSAPNDKVLPPLFTYHPVDQKMHPKFKTLNTDHLWEAVKMHVFSLTVRMWVSRPWTSSYRIQW